MTRLEATWRIQQGLGFRTDKITEIENALIEAQRELEMGKSLPRFLVIDNSQLLTAGVQEFTLPANFIREFETQPLRYIATVGAPLTFMEKRNFKDAYNAYVGKTGGPTIYSILSSTFYVFPVPDVNYIVTWTYYKKDEPLFTNFENKWLENAPELLIGEAGFRLAMDLRDAEAVAVFDKIRTAARISLFAEIVEQEQAASNFTFGGNL